MCIGYDDDPYDGDPYGTRFVCTVIKRRTSGEPTGAYLDDRGGDLNVLPCGDVFRLLARHMVAQ